MAKKKVPNIVTLKPMKVKTISEDWSLYELEDGTQVKIKPVIVDVERHVGQLSPQGEPIYQIKAGAIIDLKAKPKSKSKTKVK